MRDFEMDSRLRGDSHPVCDLALSSVRLMDDARFPWLIVVPRVTRMRDLVDLGETQRGLLWQEIAIASEVLRSAFKPHKLNVAALGNVVEQLHVHVIARFREDAAWPRPVWGVGTAQPYDPAELAVMIKRLRAALVPHSNPGVPFA